MNPFIVLAAPIGATVGFFYGFPGAIGFIAGGGLVLATMWWGDR